VLKENAFVMAASHKVDQRITTISYPITQEDCPESSDDKYDEFSSS
jgi:hypothetical protein